MTGASVREALDASVDALQAAGVDEPRLDAELLLGEAMGCERAALIADSGAEVPAAAGRDFGEMVRRRLRREPVAYILGRKGFRNLELAVDQRVLIPRPETELLVELALELQPASVLDVGTGSGAIALAVAEELPACAVTATDTSAGALEVARGNAERLGLAERVRFPEGTLPAGESFDLVLANLPYVADRDWPTLQPEVTEWEPREALLAGPDGLDAYRAFIPGSAGPLHRYAGQRAGALAVEVGEGQAEAAAALMRQAGFERIEKRQDLARIERVVVGWRGAVA
ncbi:MAG TPA: peptide chain release factor N(5)-glutamine methyltransferase [Solirubrobacterales bacterium]|jgi:release factor glutamine methyltransferase|nr:peptide chain release factor N(5)-glutamine methyltransferase [Solirubrobacterales bacterium]